MCKGDTTRVHNVFLVFWVEDHQLSRLLQQQQGLQVTWARTKVVHLVRAISAPATHSANSAHRSRSRFALRAARGLPVSCPGSGERDERAHKRLVPIPPKWHTLIGSAARGFGAKSAYANTIHFI